MAEHPLGRIDVELLKGDEAFRLGGEKMTFNVHGFWGWSVSDLVSNATRELMPSETEIYIKQRFA